MGVRLQPSGCMRGRLPCAASPHAAARAGMPAASPHHLCGRPSGFFDKDKSGFIEVNELEAVAAKVCHLERRTACRKGRAFACVT